MGNKLRLFCDVMALHNRVTGSCNMIVVKLPTNEKFKIVVDCGLFREKDCDQYNLEFPFDASEINFVFVTHNHVDHIGRLPLMVKKGYKKPIYCTPATKVLMPLALNDSCKVLKDMARVTKTHQLYSEHDVDETLELIKEIEFGKTIKLNDYIKVTMFKNGHLLGAAIILIQIKYKDEEGINLLFTGDYNSKNVFFDVPDLPKWVKKLPISIIQESTYGNVNSEQITPCFKNNIQEKMKKYGTVIVPVFSLGRCQEILKKLRELQDEDKLDRSIPIYCDGSLAIKYTNIYLRSGFGLNDNCLDFLPHNLTYVDEELRERLLYDSESKIIVTTSGSGSYGPAPMYLQKYVGNPNAMIHFTGFLFEESLGRRIKETPTGEYVKINGIMVKKMADIKFTSEYSAHAKADEMINFLNQFKNLKAVLVNHGECAVKENFAARIQKETNAKKVEILVRECLFRVGPWGIEKPVQMKSYNKE